MNRILSIVYIFLIGSFAFGSFAQHKHGKGKENIGKELLEFKIKYLAQEMDLKGEQQQRFAELYGKMTSEKRNIYRSAHQLQKKVKKDAKATEADYAKATEAMAQAKIKEGEIDKKYEDSFKKFLTSKQIYQMKQAESEFRKKLKELRSKNKK